MLWPRLSAVKEREMIRRIIGIIISSLLIGCASGQVIENDAPTFAGPEITATFVEPVNYLVKADWFMTDNHKMMIFMALNEWAVKTNNTFHYELKFTDMSKEIKSNDEIAVIKIFMQDPGRNAVGWTDWDTNDKSAYILLGSELNDNDLRRTALHELGHAFNLRFDGNKHYTGPNRSIMRPGLGELSENLECPELKEFCQLYECQVDCAMESE